MPVDEQCTRFPWQYATLLQPKYIYIYIYLWVCISFEQQSFSWQHTFILLVKIMFALRMLLLAHALFRSLTVPVQKIISINIVARRSIYIFISTNDYTFQAASISLKRFTLCTWDGQTEDKPFFQLQRDNYLLYHTSLPSLKTVNLK